jgi:DNA-directed RNA polymerase omega subunit
MNSSVIDNKYLKVLVAAQRAKQIRKGARPLVQAPGIRATHVALAEVEQGLIGFEFASSDPGMIGQIDEAGSLVVKN